jgi:hypothetical protein
LNSLTALKLDHFLSTLPEGLSETQTKTKLGAALENFPAQKGKKVLVPRMQEKEKQKKCHEE